MENKKNESEGSVGVGAESAEFRRVFKVERVHVVKYRKKNSSDPRNPFADPINYTAILTPANEEFDKIVRGIAEKIPAMKTEFKKSLGLWLFTAEPKYRLLVQRLIFSLFGEHFGVGSLCKNCISRENGGCPGWVPVAVSGQNISMGGFFDLEKEDFQKFNASPSMKRFAPDPEVAWAAYTIKGAEETQRRSVSASWGQRDNSVGNGWGVRDRWRESSYPDPGPVPVEDSDFGRAYRGHSDHVNREKKKEESSTSQNFQSAKEAFEKFARAAAGFSGRLDDPIFERIFSGFRPGSVSNSGHPPRMSEDLETLGMDATRFAGGYTKDDINKAYREAARKAHPDMGGSAEKFIRVTRAKDTLLKYAK